MLFENPKYIELFFLVPILFLTCFSLLKRRKSLIRSIGNLNIINRFSKISLKYEFLKIVLLSIILGLLVFSMLGPLKSEPERLKTGSTQVFCIIDVSRSMACQDFGEKTRLERSKEIVKSLFPWLNGNEIGIISYAGSAYFACPLTNDYTAVNFILDYWININAVKAAGSNISGVLEKFTYLMSGEDWEDDVRRVVILLSDGGGMRYYSPEDVKYTSEKFSEFNVDFISIGLGSIHGVDIETKEGSVVSRLEENDLRKFTKEFRGTYFNGNEEIDFSDIIFGNLRDSSEVIEGYKPIYKIPLLVALGIFILVLII